MEKTKRVVITGIGTVNPLAHNVPETWEKLIAGVCGIRPIQSFDTTDFKVKIAAEVKDFDPLKYFDAMEVRKLDKFSQYGLVAADEAVLDSGIKGNVNPEKFGVYLTSGQGGFGTIVETAYSLRDKGPSRVNPAAITMQAINLLAGMVGIKYNAKGAGVPVVTACATGATSIGEAFWAIRNGRQDAIIAGGAEASVYPLVIAGFQNMYALSRCEDPNAASIPFDKRRGGFVLGEGAAALVMEELEHAKARGAKIYCEVVGYGNTCDAYHITAPHPEGDGLARAVKIAVELAELKDDEKVYINAHGTGTELNDKTETKIFKKVFGERAYSMPCSSTKSMTGHMMGATGAFEAVVCVKALTTGVIPQTLNYKEKDPECDLDYVIEGARKFEADVALSTNAGFGGHNCALVFRRMK